MAPVASDTDPVHTPVPLCCPYPDILTTYLLHRAYIQRWRKFELQRLGGQRSGWERIPGHCAHSPAHPKGYGKLGVYHGPRVRRIMNPFGLLTSTKEEENSRPPRRDDQRGNMPSDRPTGFARRRNAVNNINITTATPRHTYVFTYLCLLAPAHRPAKRPRRGTQCRACDLREQKQQQKQRNDNQSSWNQTLNLQTQN